MAVPLYIISCAPGKDKSLPSYFYELWFCWFVLDHDRCHIWKAIGSDFSETVYFFAVLFHWKNWACSSREWMIKSRWRRYPFLYGQDFWFLPWSQEEFCLIFEYKSTHNFLYAYHAQEYRLLKWSKYHLFYGLLVKITAFGFLHCYDLGFQNCSCNDFEIWFSLLFSRLFLIFRIKLINHTNAYETYIRSFFKCIKATNHSDSHGSPMYIVCNKKLYWHNDQGVGFPSALSMADTALWSHIMHSVSLWKNTTSTYRKVRT